MTADSSRSDQTRVPRHVAIIMDGNGRWAEARGQLRGRGHQAGSEVISGVVETAAELGVEVLTLYAFSADNWRRPSDEVEALLGLFQRYLRDTLERLRSAGVRLTVIGRRDRLGPMLRAAVTTAEMATAAGSRLWLRLAIDYSSRDALRQAAALLPAGRIVSREAFAAALARGIGDPVGAPDVDLLIRTGGEQRLSDFLLWESAYAELLFLPVLWPDFDPAALRAAIDAFGGRQRRFGALPGRPRVSTDREAAFG